MFGLEIECKINAWIKAGDKYYDPHDKWIIGSNYPVLFKTDQGYAIHVDHNKGMPAKEDTDEIGSEGPIIELVNNPPVKVWEDEDTTAAIFRNMKSFYDEIKRETNDFTQRCQLKTILPGAPDCIYIGSNHKKSPVVERSFEIQTTYGVRLDRIKYLFELISEPVAYEAPAAEPMAAEPAEPPPEGEGAPPPPPAPPPMAKSDGSDLVYKSYSDAITWAEELRKLVWWKYRDKKYSFDVATGKKKKRHFANKFKVENENDLDDLEGFFALLLNYLIVGMQPAGAKKGWSKNYVGQLLYKTDLADIRNNLNKICQKLLDKRHKKIRGYIQEASNRIGKEGVLYQYELKQMKAGRDDWELNVNLDDGSQRRVTVKNWISDIMKGKSDLMLLAVKNPYASSLSPNLERDKLGVVAEHRKFGILIPPRIVDRIPANWEQLGLRIYKMLQELNGDEVPDIKKMRNILAEPI